MASKKWMSIGGSIVALLTMVGGLIWVASALEVGDIFNAVQVIKNMVVTRDGMPGTSSNTILNINQPGADRANQIYVMKGAFKDNTIAREDIDRSTVGSGSASFACGAGEVIQSVTSTGAVCVSMEDYWRLTDAQSPDGSIYYSQKVAVGMAASAGDFGDNAQFMVDGDLMPTGDMIVGTDARHVTVGKNDANTQLQIDVQGAPLVMGLEQHVGIGGTPNTTIDPVLTVYNDVHVDTMLVAGNTRGVTALDATTTTLAVDQPLYLGHADQATLPSGLGMISQALAASADRTAIVVTDTPSGNAATGATLTVGGLLALRGQGERGGLHFDTMNNSTPVVGTLEADYNCKVASVDDDGNVVLKEDADCVVEPPVCFETVAPTILQSDNCLAPSFYQHYNPNQIYLPGFSSTYIGEGISFVDTSIMPPYRAARFYNDYVPSFDIYSFTSYPSLSFFRGLMNQAPYYSLNVDEDCNGEPDPLMLGRRINVSFTFDASSIDEQLYLGIMADNDFEVFVNGKEYVSFIHADSSETFPFLYLSFFPISLCGDGNVITISGWGDGSVNDALGFIFFDNTKEQILSATSMSDLTIVAKSGDMVGEKLDIVTCPSGYSYDSDQAVCIRQIDGEGCGGECVLNATVAVDGSCGTTQNTCIAGTPVDVVDSSTSYQWSCIGEDGGTSVTCTEAFPPTYGWDTGEWSVCTESVTNSCEWNGATYDPSGRCASTCFIADTLVIMGDGRQIPIQDVRIGDQLQGETTINTVLGFYQPTLQDQLLYSFNGGPYFVTAAHPFMTTEGWKAIDPVAARQEHNLTIIVGQLRVGDTLITDQGTMIIHTIDAQHDNPDTQLYNFIVDGDHTYYADGYLVHNKTSNAFCNDNSNCGVGQICVGASSDPEIQGSCEYNPACEDIHTQSTCVTTPDFGGMCDWFSDSCDGKSVKACGETLGCQWTTNWGCVISEEEPADRCTGVSSEDQCSASGLCEWNSSSSWSQTRGVVCRDAEGNAVSDSYCADQVEPSQTRACTIDGQCGGADGGSAYNTGSLTTMCAEGTLQWSDIGAADGTWNWECVGYGAGAQTDSCEAYRTPHYSWQVSRWSVCSTEVAGECSGETSSTIDLPGGGYCVATAYSCFIADTLVTMADGSTKPIQDVRIGDVLQGATSYNTVLGYHQPLLGEKLLYSFNGGPYFVTAEHPFMTTDGWKAIDPVLAIQEHNLDIPVKQLRIGDTLITDDGMVVLETIDTQSDNPTTQLYNFILDGDRTYYADGYLVHNKDACGSGGTCNPGWVCGSVGMEIIPYPPYDTGTCVRWDHYDCASKAKADCSPSKKCAWINGGGLLMLCEDQTDQQTCNNAGCDWTDPVPSSQTRFVSCVDDSTGLTVDDQYCADALITADVMPDTDNDGVPDDQRVCGVCPEGTTGTYPDCTQNPVADMCDNIDGTQSTMPSHMVQDGDSCVCSDGYRMTGDGICVFDGSAYKCHSAAWIPTISPCLTSTYNPNISYAEGDVVCSTTTPSTLNCLYNPQ